MCVLIRGKIESDVSSTAARISGSLARLFGPGVIASDASPAPLARAKGLFRYQLMLRAAKVSSITQPLRAVLGTLKCPKGVQVTIDVDALSLL